MTDRPSRIDVLRSNDPTFDYRQTKAGFEISFYSNQSASLVDSFCRDGD
jgi:hypothetical protein